MTIQDRQKFGRAVPWLAVLLALVTVWLLLLPKLEAIRQTAQELDQARAKVDTKTKELESLRKLATQQGAAGRSLQLLAIAAPGQAQVPELLIMVEAIAGRAGLALVNASPASSQTGTKLNITLKGGYGGMASFFDLLNRNIRPAKVNTFSVVNQAGAPGEASETLLTANLEFVGGAINVQGSAVQAELEQPR